MGRFQTGLDRVATRMDEINGETVTYRRAGVDYPVTAATQKLDAEQMSPGLGVTRVELQQWGIDADALGLTPTAGDTITRADGSVYQVISPDGTIPVYRLTTSSENRYLIFSQKIGNATT